MAAEGGILARRVLSSLLFLTLAGAVFAYEDWGDAPSPFPTTQSSNGARHTGPSSHCLGSRTDGELDGQPTADATGDDTNGDDDEDGVGLASGTALVIGLTRSIRVTSCTNGSVLDAWLDIDGDQVWEATEKIVDGQPLSIGVNDFPVAIPSDVAPGYRFGRFRVTGVGIGSVNGLAPDGEVEDHRFELVLPDRDFGDARIDYGTRLTQNGARHRLVSALYLGSSVDSESDGQLVPEFEGDDQDGSDDEDGVVFGPLFKGYAGTVTVTASAPGKLDAWVNWNDDYDWDDPGEKVFDGVDLVAGANDLLLTVPSDAVRGDSRFRFSSAGTSSPVGEALDGEVEDHRVPILPTTTFVISPIDNYSFEGSASDGSSSIGPFWVIRTDGAREITLEYWTEDVEAEAGTDYTGIAPTPLTFAVGETQKQISVTISGDDTIEPDETFLLRIGNPSPATEVVFDNDTVTLTIGQDEADFGDVPEPPYLPSGTVEVGNGPYHLLAPAASPLRLGAFVDLDHAGQPSADATGDDADGTDDEDGVSWTTPIAIGATASVSVEASAAGLLNAWVDFDKDGIWGEQIVTDHVFAGAGTADLEFAVPETATPGTTFARFRFSTASAGPLGGAPDGEVEDYQVALVAATELSIDDPEIVEGTVADGVTQLVFTVSRNHNDMATSVDFAVTGGTATAGSDFATLSPGTLSFAATGALTQQIVIDVSGDNDVEPTETVEITLSNPAAGSKISDALGVGTIFADELDYGDAPAPFPTLLADDGARHVAGPLFLGTEGVDVEPDGQPSSTADGDDAHDANDDEEGVEFPEYPLLQGETEPVTVTSSAPGLLDAWVDFDGNGVWDPTEKVFAAEAVVAGSNALQIDVPAGAAVGFAISRFRLSSAGAALPTGLANDGEIEDHRLEITAAPVDTEPPRVVAVDTVQPTPGNDGLVPGEMTSAYITQLLVTFSEAMADPAGDGEPFDVTNMANYFLAGDEGDGFTSSDCVNRIVGNDWEVPLSGVTYASGTFTSTLTIEGAPLPDGEYRFLACGSTSLEDPSGNPLDGNGDGTGGDDFVLDFTLAETIPVAHPGDSREAVIDTSIVLGDFPSATGGTPPYSYSWTVTPQTAGTGSYTLDSATDANPYFSASVGDEYVVGLEVTDANALASGLQETSIFVGCDNLDLFNDTIVGPVTYKARQRITAEEITIGGAGTVFKAGIEVVLMEGFLVESDAGLTVVIDPTTDCD